MKKLLFFGLALLFTGCATGPLMQSKMDWARMNARQYGYVPVHTYDGTRYVPRGVAAERSPEVLQQEVAVGELRSFDAAALAQQMDPSGVWWRKAGDTSLLATATGLLVWGGTELAGSINDSSSSNDDFSSRVRQDVKVEGEGNVVVVGGDGPSGYRDTTTSY